MSRWLPRSTALRHLRIRHRIQQAREDRTERQSGLTRQDVPGVEHHHHILVRQREWNLPAEAGPRPVIARAVLLHRIQPPRETIARRARHGARDNRRRHRRAYPVATQHLLAVPFSLLEHEVPKLREIPRLEIKSALGIGEAGGGPLPEPTRQAQWGGEMARGIFLDVRARRSMKD